MSMMNISVHVSPTWVKQVEADGVIGLDREDAGVVRLYDHDGGWITICTPSVASARSLARVLIDILGEAKGKTGADPSAP